MSVGGREARWVTGGREAGNVLAVRGDVAGRGPRGVPVWYYVDWRLDSIKSRIQNMKPVPGKLQPGLWARDRECRRGRPHQ